MSATIDMMNPDQPKRVLMVAANPAISPTTGWPIGVWAAELTHPILGVRRTWLSGDHRQPQRWRSDDRQLQ